jgi:O-antigen/teichoic acid export membrane protein
MIAINGVQAGVLTGFESFRAVALVNSVRGLVTIPALWVGGRTGGPFGAVCGLVVTWTASCLVSSVLVRHVARSRGVPLRAPGFWSEWRQLLAFSLPGWVAGLLAGAANWLGTVFLARQPDGLEQNGLLGAANQLFLLVMFFPQIIGSTSLPLLSERVGANDALGAQRVTRKLLLVVASTTVPLVVLLSLASPVILKSFGPGYGSGWLVLVLSMVTVPFYGASMVIANGVVAHGRMWAFTALHALYFVTLVGAAWSLATLGALGYASARLSAYVVFCLGTHWYSRSLSAGRRSGLAT